MTLRETESILETLRKRHPDLTSEMLVTLLRAGGWEEKQITEAKALFEATQESKKEAAMLPPIQEAPVFQAPPDNDHLLLSKNEGTPVEEISHSVEKKEMSVPVTKEPESLVQVPKEEKVVHEDLPHNLPLRPFETSEHIWPFSKYKDMFHGGAGEELPDTKKSDSRNELVFAPTAQAAEEKQEEPVSLVHIEKPIEKRTEESPLSEAPHPVSPHEHADDEKLVITACVMLLVILLLLGYMYSNGRL